MLPTVDFLGKQISRLIVGDNPVNGHSYIPDLVTGDEMVDYYTEQNLLGAMERAQQLGYTAWLPLGNDFMLRAIRHFRNAGGRLDVMFQSYPPVDFAVNLRQMAECRPLGIYHQGTTTDGLCESGQHKILRERIKMIKELGIAAGLGTHVPETVKRAEDEDWGVDFYVTCLHNSRKRDPSDSSFLTGKKKTIRFFMEDRPEMLRVIGEVGKPCIAFKIFAGGQVFYDRAPEDYPSIVEDAFRETFAGVKPGDIAAVGCFQRDRDQLAENAAIAERVLTRA